MCLERLPNLLYIKKIVVEISKLEKTIDCMRNHEKINKSLWVSL